jgi:hypothetical protein
LRQRRLRGEQRSNTDLGRIQPQFGTTPAALGAASEGLVGLFSEIMHVRKVPPSELVRALDTVMLTHGFVRNGRERLSDAAPNLIDDGVGYACGPLRGDWCTIVQAHFHVDGASSLSDVGRDLSNLLGTHVLSLDLHDGDVFYYYLDERGKRLDQYDSEPMYFMQEPLAESEIEERRHHPEAFAPLLPAGVRLEDLVSMLDNGWWSAHDKGELDERGLMTDEAYFADDQLQPEERMTAFGDLLQLHGAPSDYPFVAWAEAPPETWSGFTLVTYARRQ